jgi:hypothetical protein
MEATSRDSVAAVLRLCLKALGFESSTPYKGAQTPTKRKQKGIVIEVIARLGITIFQSVLVGGINFFKNDKTRSRGDLSHGER